MGFGAGNESNGAVRVFTLTWRCDEVKAAAVGRFLTAASLFPDNFRLRFAAIR